MERRVNIDDYSEGNIYPTRDETQAFINGLAALVFLDEDAIRFKPDSVQKAIKSVYRAVAIGALPDISLEMLNELLPGKEGNLTPIAMLDIEGEDYYYNPDEQPEGWRE